MATSKSSGDWFKKLSPEQKAAYKAKHPDSQLESVRRPSRVVCESSSPLAQAIQAKLDEMGFQVRVPDDLPEGKYVKVYSGKIDPQSLGQFAPVFESIKVEIQVGLSAEENMADISMEYDWQHPRGGHNGKSLRFWYKKGQWEQVS